MKLLYEYLKKHDKDAIDTLIKLKRRILLYYDIDKSKLEFPLNNLTVKISEWIFLLKSFPFFTEDQIINKIEKFKRHVLNENNDLVEINGLEFLKSTYSFYETQMTQDEEVKKTNRDSSWSMVMGKMEDIKP